MVEGESLRTDFCKMWSVCGRLGGGGECVSDLSPIKGVSGVCAKVMSQYDAIDGYR
jgi:hypothetical protein